MIGRAKFKEPGRTLQEARARVPAFIARTDHEIAIARGQLQLSADEHIDRIPQTFNLQDPDEVDAVLRVHVWPLICQTLSVSGRWQW